MPVRPPNPDNIRSTLLNAAHIDHDHAHGDLTGVTSDQHHAEAHSVASHNDTTATGAELETLTDGSDADALHAHVTLGPTLTEEEVEDFVGGMLTGNTETLITVTYQDADGTIDFVVDNDLSNYNNSVSAFITDVTGSPLSELSDVTITSIVSGEILKWNGSAWINQTLAEAGISATGHSHTESDVTDLDHDDTDAIHDNVAGEIALVTEKATPVSADLLLIEDSAAANAKKRVQVGNLPGGTSDHGSLTGLADDDHTQYLNIARFADSIDFDVDADTGNLSLLTGFQNSTTHTYTPPAGWTTYKIVVLGQATVAAVNSADDVQSLIVIDGSNGDVVSDNAAATDRTIPATAVNTGLSGNVDVSYRIRNSTAARGAAYTTWLQIIAVRET